MKFRVDDVLQTTLFKEAQTGSLAQKPMFEWFKEVGEMFEGKRLTLAIVAEGIDSQPEWVEYIKAHPEWIPQVHCWEHRNHKWMSYDEIVKNLGRAKKKIDETFGVNTTEFIPPKLGYSETTEKAAKAVGLTEDRLRYMPEHWWKNRTITSVFFHFWNPRQIRRVKFMLKEVTVE